MYAKHISLLVGITNMYGGIFYQLYLLPYLNIPHFFDFLNFVLCNSSDVVFGF